MLITGPGKSKQFKNGLKKRIVELGLKSTAIIKEKRNAITFQQRKATHQRNVANQLIKNVSNNYPFFKTNEEVIASLKEDFKVET